MRRPLSLILPLFFALGACVPDVYLVDRHTVMEMEASGDWPQLDKVFYEKVQTAGPVPFINDPESARKKRVKNMLNGEFSAYSLVEHTGRSAGGDDKSSSHKKPSDKK